MRTSGWSTVPFFANPAMIAQHSLHCPTNCFFGRYLIRSLCHSLTTIAPISRDCLSRHFDVPPPLHVPESVSIRDTTHTVHGTLHSLFLGNPYMVRYSSSLSSPSSISCTPSVSSMSAAYLTTCSQKYSSRKSL